MTRWRGHKPSYRAGDHLMICERSGFVMRRSDAMKTWDGKWVHKDFWEPRHPQDFVRGVKERIVPDVVRPEPATDYEIQSDTEVTAEDL